MTDLRSRQKTLARLAILDALGELVAETRHLDFSMQQVAERAGVSPRTVYNHFDSREDLLDGLLAHFNGMMADLGGVFIDTVDDVAGLFAALPTNFRVFSEMSPLAEAWEQIAPVSPVIRQDHDARTDRMVEIIGQELPGLTVDEQRRVAHGIRHLFSFRSWYGLTHDYGLDVEDAIAIVTWTARLMIERAADGDVPTRQEPT